MAEVRIDPTALQRMMRLPGGLVERSLRKRAGRAADEARRTAPGSMGQFIPAPRIEGRGRALSAVIVCTHPATRYVVKGTPRHMIYPVRARALRFTTGGRIVFAAKVNHPGTAANDFLNAALRRAL